jgi:hypothetical protein
MEHDQVCSWLHLPPGSWPPDHYTLLGLPPGEADPARVEQHVHERLTRLRPLQLHYPEQVTEAMNLLARAFSCLTDPEAKRAYDAALFGQPAPPAPVALPAPEEETEEPSIASLEPSAAAADPLAWLFGPWNPQAASAPAPPAPPPRILKDWASAPPPPRQLVPPAAPPAPHGEVNGAALGDTQEAVAETAEHQVVRPAPVDPLVKVAHSTSARRGLATKRALYHRIARTRELLWAWERAGKYLNHPERPLVRSSEAVELTRQLLRIRRQLSRFPPLLGEAGQPGFYVITLANQPKAMIVPTFRMLLPVQRETLARDWRDGHKLLSAHRDFLRAELRALRKTSWLGRLVRTADHLFADHPGLFLLLALLIAVVAASVLSFLH